MIRRWEYLSLFGVPELWMEYREATTGVLEARGSCCPSWFDINHTSMEEVEKLLTTAIWVEITRSLIVTSIRRWEDPASNNWYSYRYNSVNGHYEGESNNYGWLVMNWATSWTDIEKRTAAFPNLKEVTAGVALEEQIVFNDNPFLSLKTKCECGGTKSNTSHSNWCPVYDGLNK